MMPKKDKRKQWKIIWKEIVKTPVSSEWKNFKLSNKIIKEAHIRKQTGLMWIRKAKAMQYLRHKGVPVEDIVNYFRDQGIPVTKNDLYKVKREGNFVKEIRSEISIKGDKKFIRDLIQKATYNEIVGIDARFNPQNVEGGDLPWEEIEHISP